MESVINKLYAQIAALNCDEKKSSKYDNIQKCQTKQIKTKRILRINTDKEYADADAIVVDNLKSKARHVYLPGIYDTTRDTLENQMYDAMNRIDSVLRRAGGSLANIISMVTRVDDLTPEKQWIYSGVRKERFDNNAIWPGAMYPASMLTGVDLESKNMLVKIFSHAIYEIPADWKIKDVPHEGLPLEYNYGTYVIRQNLLTDNGIVRGYSQAVVIDYLLTGVREVYPAGYNNKDDPDLYNQTDRTFQVLIDIINVSGGTVDDIFTMLTSIPNLDKERLKIFNSVFEKYFGDDKSKQPKNTIISTRLATYIATVEVMPIAVFKTPDNWKLPAVYTPPSGNN